MPRATFEREIRALQDQILSLGSEVEENLVKAVAAMQTGNDIQARRLIEADVVVNERRINIGLAALRLIATQQPIAGDMRTIAAVLEIVGELERIHDYIKGIGKITLMLNNHSQFAQPLLQRMPEMAEKAREMLHQSLTAFARRDAETARQIPVLDDEVDALYRQIYFELMQYVMAHPNAVEAVNLVEWALHNLERSADRVTNICEWVVYMVEGEYKELDSEVEAPPAL